MWTVSHCCRSHTGREERKQDLRFVIGPAGTDRVSGNFIGTLQIAGGQHCA
jgi:hypothetical protein